MSAPFQTNCPANANTATTCNVIPNALWIPASAGCTSVGTCNCCLTDGTVYVNPSDSTPGSNPCNPCPSNATCGQQDGFCNGTTNNSNATCIQNQNTLMWSADCSNAGCGGLCSGSCGAGEWFAFQSCQQTTGPNACSFDVMQYKSWLVYGSLVLVIFIILILYFFLWRTPQQKVQIVNQPTANIPSSAN